MKAYIAQQSNGSYCIMRIMPKEHLADFMGEDDFVSKFNAFASSNNIQELLEAIEALPPLLPCQELFGKEPRKRFFSISTVKEKLGKQYLPCEAASLEDEAHFDAGVPSPNENRKRATNGVIRHNDATAGEFASLLSTTDADRAVVVVEPLLDWVFARNLVGMTARLLGTLRNSANENVLNEAGFIRRHNKRAERWLYMLPFAYNPFHVGWKPRVDSIKAKLGEYTAFQPLMEVALQTRKTEGKGINPVTYWCFDKSEAVYLLTFPVANEEYKLFYSKEGMDDKRYYLCITDDGDSQRALAEKAVVAFVETVRNLTNTVSGEAKQTQKGKGSIENLGWEYDQSCIFKKPYSPALRPRSVFSELMYRLLFNSNFSIGTCKNCGNAILTSDKGAPRSYCSDACRMRDKRKATKCKEDENG